MVACEKVGQYYFQLPVASTDNPVYRERVYCYELYHQLRGILGDDYSYRLHGEPNKSGHPIISERCGRRIPDLVVHEPGDMSRNLAVVEVKPVTVLKNLRGLKKDIEKLICFLENANYQYAIQLVYGSIAGSLPQRIIRAFQNQTEGYENRIFLLWHPRPGIIPVSITPRSELQVEGPES
jgi:hypothetical protein